MRRLVLLALVALVPATAVATVPPPPVGAPAVSIISFAPPPVSVICEGRDVRIVESAPVRARTRQVWTPPVPVKSPTAAATEAYSFSINGDGAVSDLKRVPGPFYWPNEDVMATLATWRFAPGAPVKGCKVDLPSTTVPIADASPAKLFEAFATDGRNAPAALREALASAGDCGKTPRRRPQTIVYPDLRSFDGKSLNPAWAGVRYDIDTDGAVRNARIVAQNGETAFADTAAAAIAESRYLPGSPRTACFATFSARPRATPAPSRPDIKALARPGDTCKITQAQMNVPANKTYPPAYAARQVAGWAIVRFDVAPWGQIGNVEVVASQPSDAFGVAARNLVSAARPTAPPTGYRGCLVPILYAIPDVVEDEY